MVTRIIELRQERAAIIRRQQAVMDQATLQGRSYPNAEEQSQIREMIADEKRLKVEIDRLEREERETSGSDGYEPHRPDPGGGSGRQNGRHGQGQEYRFWDNPNGEGDPRRTFDRYLVYGSRGLSDREYRALQVNVDIGGGYLVAPEQMANQLIRGLDDELFMMTQATVLPVDAAQSLGVPTLEADPSAPDWTTELETGSEDTAMSFGKRQLHPHPLAKRIKISRTLLRTATLNPSDIVRDRLTYTFGVALENGFMTGDGAQKPLGLFVASDDGIPTSRDVSTDNTTTDVTFDGLLNAQHGIKPQYRRRASWVFHDDALLQIRKIKDGDGTYLFQPSVTVGMPDMLLGSPVRNSQYAPNTFTASQYVGLYGDLSQYWIAMALNLEILVLSELYAESNQIGMIGRLELDGQPVLAEAFARVQLAAA